MLSVGYLNLKCGYFVFWALRLWSLCSFYHEKQSKTKQINKTCFTFAFFLSRGLEYLKIIRNQCSAGRLRILWVALLVPSDVFSTSLHLCLVCLVFLTHTLSPRNVQTLQGWTLAEVTSVWDYDTLSLSSHP